MTKTTFFLLMKSHNITDQELEWLESADAYNLLCLGEFNIQPEQVQIFNTIQFAKFLFSMDEAMLKLSETDLEKGHVEEVFTIIKNAANDEFWLNYVTLHPQNESSEYFFRLNKDKYIVITE